MSARPSSHSSQPPPAYGLTEVRYSLPGLLRDVQEERNTSSLASDKIDQLEILKLFEKNRARRAARPRK